jgi:hypothetical protein
LNCSISADADLPICPKSYALAMSVALPAVRSLTPKLSASSEPRLATLEKHARSQTPT